MSRGLYWSTVSTLLKTTLVQLTATIIERLNSRVNALQFINPKG